MRWGVFVSLLLLAPLANAAQLRELRVWDSPGSTRVVFDLHGASNPKVFTLASPDRVVIDFDGVDAASMARAAAAAPKGVVRSVRTGARPQGIRVVLDVSTPVTARSFASTPNDHYGDRVIIDLTPVDARAAAVLGAVSAGTPTPAPTSATAPAAAAVAPAPAPVAPPPVAVAPRAQEKALDKQVVIAIDAGHGGEDPGAIGKSGLQEKNVSLAIARKLALLINTQPNMRAVLTRDGDYYVGLRQRVDFARRHQADMFVSVHCNAFHRSDMRGTAVYVLSDRGATSEHARWLANKENSADLVGGVDLHNKDGDLAAVLIDLSQSATMEASFDIGGRILRSMGQVNSLQKADVQQAGFMVLKAPDIPSVLVETAFITNPQEEKLLANEEYQAQLAASILGGIRGYFQSYRPRQQMVEAAPQVIPAAYAPITSMKTTTAVIGGHATSVAAAPALPATPMPVAGAPIASMRPAVNTSNPSGLTGAAGLRAALRAASYTQVSPVTQSVSR